MVYISNGMLLNHQKRQIPFALTWMELEGIMLNEKSQLEKDNHHMVSLIGQCKK